MSLDIKQSSTPGRGDRWNWAIWLEGPAAELDQVDFVRYHLHPTFPSPVQDISDRESQFRLDAVGWGEFQIRVEIHRGAAIDERRHWLQLGGDTVEVDAPEAPMPRGASIFISSGVADQPFADALREILEGQGAEVLTSDEPLLKKTYQSESLASGALFQAGHAVFILSDRPSSSVRRELDLAAKLEIPVTAICIGPNALSQAKVDGLNVVQIIELDEFGDPATMANQAAAHLVVA